MKLLGYTTFIVMNESSNVVYPMYCVKRSYAALTYRKNAMFIGL